MSAAGRANRAREGGRAWARRVACALGVAASVAVAPGARVRLALAENAPREARLPPLELRIDPNDIDLDGGQLTATLSRPAQKLTLKLLGLEGAVLAELEQDFGGARAGAPLVLRWSPPAQAVARVEVFGHDTSGYYKGIAITPWSFEVPHEDVVFATDSAVVEPDQEKKLEVSLKLIQKQLPRARHLGNVTLFILAHTDSVGTADYNLKLSTRRALAITRWFRAHGLSLPVAYDGVGESMLRVKTADEVDEPRNRRVDYMLGVEPPRFKQSRVVPAWKRL